MDWLKEYNIYVQGAILSSIIAGFLIFTVSILYLFKIKIPKERMKYVYAFSSGFLLITAIVGQWVSARHNLQSFWESQNSSASDPDPTIGQSFISIAIVLGGIFLGSLVAFGMKIASSHDKHNHDETIHSVKHDHKFTSHPSILSTPVEDIHESKVHKERNTIIYMILSHRIPAGLIIGILLVNFNFDDGEYSLAALLAFLVHMIPDMLIVYYARVDAGYSRLNSFIFSIFAKLIIIPFIFIGITASEFTSMTSPSTFWIIPIFLSMAGIIMTWGSIFELAPSFIHAKTNKETYRIIFMFIIGLSLAMSIQLIHSH